MQPRVTVLTLGVSDLEQSLTFYRDGLGLPTQGIVGQQFEHSAVAVFELQNGLVLALRPRTSIARDGSGATDFTLQLPITGLARLVPSVAVETSAGRDLEPVEPRTVSASGTLRARLPDQSNTTYVLASAAP
jgi:catechol 2,3-dioxygenase-like lactoylglutathione lyase family enzyme